MRRVALLAAGGIAACAAIGAWVARSIDNALRDLR